MAWYNTLGKEHETVLSSRIRFARNLSAYPFPGMISNEQALEINESLGKLLENNGFSRIDFSNISKIEATTYAEKHYVSPEFVSKKEPHVLMLNEQCGIAIMLCEEDHIRLQCILPGLSLKEAYRSACEADNIIDANFDIAYSEEFGYLTHCPTNLGTGMRASVMMFLPALTMSGYINKLANQLSKIGLTVRGIYGEGSKMQGYVYQISNQITLGLTEEDTISKLEDAIKQIIENENNLRKSIKGESFERLYDKISRSEGMLRYARRISAKEFMSAFADIRLGISLGMIKNISYNEIDELWVSTMPANIMYENNLNSINEWEQEHLRAELIKKVLNSKKITI